MLHRDHDARTGVFCKLYNFCLHIGSFLTAFDVISFAAGEWCKDSIRTPPLPVGRGTAFDVEIGAITVRA